MSGSNSSNNVIELAARMRADIKSRSLKPGDRYLNSADAARQFQVSTHAANRALQLLAKRRIVTRKQRLGTVVALEVDEQPKAAGIERIHLLVREDYFKSEGVLADGVVMGIQGELPRVGIQFNFMPEAEEARYVEDLVDQVLKSDAQEAFVLVRASLMTQRIIAQSGCPAVVHGIPYPSVEPLSSIDRDHARGAKILVDYLVRERGCRRLLVLMRERLHAGDHLFLDAIQEGAGEAKLGVDKLTLRYLPADEQLVNAEIKSVLGGSAPEPTGVICLNELLANLAKGPVERASSSATPHAVVLSTFYRRLGHKDPGCPHLHLGVTPEAIGADIAHLLLRQCQGEHGAVHKTYPLELRGA